MNGLCFRVPEKLVPVLDGAGWSSERSVDISVMAERIRSMGYSVHSEAACVLRSFGGLRLVDVRGREMCMDGAAATASFEPDELPYIERLAPAALCPVATLGGMVYFVAEDGRWVVLDDGWTVVYCFAGVGDALLFALSDEIPVFERRVLRSEDAPEGYF